MAKRTKKDTFKSQIITHQNRSSSFYNKIRSLKYNNKIVVSFDLQKQLHLPKHNTSPVYYFPKIWRYNFGLLLLSINERNSCSIYQWNELHINKSTNVIAAAIIDYLKTNNNNFINE